MTTIFLSYRRDDSSGQAGRLYDHMSQHFGADNVFMDVDAIDLGIDFKGALRQAVEKCDVMLVIIGPDWLDCVDKETGKRRLDDPNDWVRIETTEALQRAIPVIPVLVRGAELPAAKNLPDALAALVDRQATILSDRQWSVGIADLVNRLKAIPRRRETEMTQRWLARFGLRRLAMLAVLMVAIVGVALWLLWPVDVVVPPLIGRSLTEARMAIEAGGLGFRDDQVVYEESLTEPAGKVIRQEPIAGLRVSKGQAIRIAVAKVPPPVDLSRYVSIRDVGTEGTIAATAAVMAIEVAAAGTRPNVRLSERYLYQKAKRHDETQGEGTWMTAIIYVAEQFGVAPYAMWPYKSGDSALPQGTTWQSLDAAAAAYKAHFSRVTQLSAIYDQLRQGRPVLASVRIGPEWMTDSAAKTGNIVIDASKPDASKLLGLGAVVIVGFDPNTKLFLYAHSWSQSWGKQGFGTMSVQTAESLVDLSSTWAVEASAAR
jgi:hypothetical protein